MSGPPAPTKSCPFCAEQVQATAVKCKHCGSMLDKPPVIGGVPRRTGDDKRKAALGVKIGLGIVGAFVLIGIIGNLAEPSHEAPSKKIDYKTQADSAAEQAPRAPRRAAPAPAAPSLPAIQAAFMSASTGAAEEWRAAPNELKKSAVRKARGRALREALNARRQFDGWVGTLKKMKTNSDGDAVLEVTFGDVTLKTWNNAFSDHAAHTLVKSGTPLFDSIAELSEGTQVIVSGAFLADDRDFVRESSLSEQGSMTEPEFIAKFSAVRKQ